MTGRWLDQFLGDPVGDATRAEVLKALRGHVFGELITEEENPDGSTASHVSGVLVEAGHDPDDRDITELFSVVSEQAAMGWHKAAETLAKYPAMAEAVGAPPLLTFGVPDAGIIQYPGAEPGQAGYRFTREDGSALAIILWHGVMHVTDDGDLAPGVGGFTVTVKGEDE